MSEQPAWLLGLTRAVAGARVAAAGPGDAIDGVQPAAVLWARAPEQAAAALRFAAGEGLAVAPRGAGTHLGLGARPARVDLILDLSGLQAPVDLQPADMTATFPAGTSLAAVQAALAAHGQWLPLDPPADPRATVGGLLAVDASGPCQLAWGRLRDLLLGARFVRADGELAKAGGRVVKNVTGYDFCKLLVGSLGTLAVITEATFKVSPLPAARRALVAPLRDPGEMEAALAALLDSDASPAFLDVVAGAAAASLAGVSGRADALPLALAAGFAGPEEAVTWQAAHAGEVLGRAVPAARVRPLPWEAVHEGLLEAHRPAARGGVTVRVAVKSSDLAPLGERAARLCQEAGFAPAWAAHGGNGILTVQLEPGDVGAAAAVVEGLRAEAAACGGSATVTAAPPRSKERLDVWGPPGAAWPLMRGLKERFDPHSRLNPGRLAGGL